MTPFQSGCNEKGFRLKANAGDGVTDGDRTRDNRNHNPGLYQLSYGHHNKDGLYSFRCGERNGIHS